MFVFALGFQGAVDIEAITDPLQRQSIELQIREFGQTPKQVVPCGDGRGAGVDLRGDGVVWV